MPRVPPVAFVPAVAAPPVEELPLVEEIPPVLADPPVALVPPLAGTLPPDPLPLVLATEPPALVALVPPVLVFVESDWPQAPMANPTNPKTNRVRV